MICGWYKKYQCCNVAIHLNIIRLYVLANMGEIKNKRDCRDCISVDSHSDSSLVVLSLGVS